MGAMSVLYQQLMQIIPGLPDNCMELTLTLKSGEQPAITTTCLVTSKHACNKITQTFILVPNSEPEVYEQDNRETQETSMLSD